MRTVQGSNDTLNWILSDHLGSASVTANADGTWNSEIKYTAFGEVRASYGLTPTDYRYTGQLEQASINLYWYRSRWFDGELAHFVQADTLIPDPGDPLAWDRYAYGFNNPLNYNDPSGHWPEWGNVYDWIQGAIYQFSNDTSMGAVDKVALYYGKCMYCNVSDAYRQGQQAGRITSTVVGTVEQVGGAFTAGAGAAMIPPTLGGGAVCTGLTVGVCALPTGGALGLEAGMVAAGAGVYIHGTGVVAFAKNNPLQSGRTPTEINKSIKSLEDLISDHTKKLEDYKNNPDQFDNQGFLRNAPNNEIRQQIINSSCYQRKLILQAKTNNATLSSKPLAVTA